MEAKTLFGLEGKIALVTGGGSGIGLMIAKGFASNGAIVYIGGRRKDVVEKAAAGFEHLESGGKILPLELDVTSKESILSVVKVIETAHGRLDILVNNAGQVGPTSSFIHNNATSAPERESAATLGLALFNNESFEEWASLFTINVSSIFFVTTALLGLLAAGSGPESAGGSGPYSANVINITSISGNIKVAQAHFAYNASKSAGDHITKMLATEFALKGVQVRVNAIAPGLFPTEMTNKEGSEFNAEDTTSISGALHPVPSGRSGNAAEIAGSALYLASQAGRYTNGQILIPDGGWTAVNPSTR